jgi:Kef-type K+ transport system membrane component KefB
MSQASTPTTGRPWGRIAALAFSLSLVFLVTTVALWGSPADAGVGRLTVLIGFVLLAASAAGGLAAQATLPRLTGFLLVGLLAGPSVLGIMTPEVVADLRLIDEFALALIALLAGGELKVGALRPQARAITAITGMITLIVWIGVGATVVLVRPLTPFLADAPMATTLGIAVLLGVWAANSSPDLTVAVIEETGAKGVLTDTILGTTIVKDVVVIVLFTLTLALVVPFVEPGESFSAHVFVDLAIEVGGALLVGAGMGWIFSLYLGDVKATPRSPFATFVFVYLIVVIAARLHIELLLTGVAAGFVIENLSPAGDRMIRGIESVSVVIFAFFFTVAGATLDLGAVREFWLPALLIFGSRAGFTWLGTRAGARLAGASEEIRVRAWRGMISQGGVTLGLVLLIQRSMPSVGSGVVALGMAIIVGNILGGPILLKSALSGPEPDVAEDA